jgi:hypothetical protein
MHEIKDKREQKLFNKTTYSNFKKLEVLKQLELSILNSKLEDSINWSAELICSGHFIEIWNIILQITCKHIHLGNPKLSIYIDKQFIEFKQIIKDYIGFELILRNNETIRYLFFEIIFILCKSNKKPAVENAKINKLTDFNLLTLNSKFKAPNLSYISSCFKSTDPKELLLPLNEYAFNLKNKHTLNCFYWIEWLIEFDCICRKNKTMLTCSYRQIEINHKFQVDVIWILWDIIFDMSKHDKLLYTIIQSLRNIFCIKYSFSVKKKRKHILYFATQLITESNNLNIDILNTNDKQILQSYTSKLNQIYFRIDNSVKKELDVTKIIDQNTGKKKKKIDMILKI